MRGAAGDGEHADDLGDGDLAPDLLSTPRRQRWPSRLPREAAGVGWAVAAALTLAAPFGDLNTISRRQDGGRQRLGGIDGWGQDHPSGVVIAVGPGVAFGVALWICAAGLLAALIYGRLALIRSRRHTADGSAGRWAAVASVAAPAALIGVVASMVLAAQSFSARFNASALASQPGRSGDAVYQSGFGLGLWLAVVAVVVSIAASVAFLRTSGAEVVLAGDPPSD